jgi:hypothetical protein
VTDEDDIIRRLRALGSTPVDDQVRRRHLATVARASDDGPARHALPRRRVLVASIAAVSLVLGGFAVAMAGDDPDRSTVIMSDDGPSDPPGDDSPGPGGEPPTGDPPPDDLPVDPFPDDLCKGPPPFAGQDPHPPAGPDGADGEGAGRQAESDLWETSKATCPDEAAPPASVPPDRPDAGVTGPSDDRRPRDDDDRAPGADEPSAVSDPWPDAWCPAPPDQPSPAPGCPDPPVDEYSEARPDR